jgi:hypothetical protein
MTDMEGIIKYTLDFTESEAPELDLEELNIWRCILFELRLIGQVPGRYEGLGFGNLSVRRPGLTQEFVISASQTGHLEKLQQEHYTQVDSCDIAANRVVAHGPLPPSSEAMTHAMFYQLSSDIGCVLHVHDPMMWLYALDAGWPGTAPDVEYGTVKMAREVERLFRDRVFDDMPCLVMAGHHDGLVFFGNSVDAAGSSLLDAWVLIHCRSADATGVV